MAFYSKTANLLYRFVQAFEEDGCFTVGLTHFVKTTRCNKLQSFCRVPSLTSQGVFLIISSVVHLVTLMTKTETTFRFDEWDVAICHIWMCNSFPVLRRKS